MSDNNKIVYSNQGIKILVNDQGQGNEVSKLKGVVDQAAYEYLEVSGNVEFLNDVNITGDISAANIELLPASTKRVLFNNVGKISSSADFVWDFDTNKLSIVGEISASTFVKGDGSGLINLKSSELDYNTIALGNTTLGLGQSTSAISGLTSITSTYFYGDLDGKIDITNNISSHGEYFIPIVAGAGSQTIYRDTGLSFLTSTHTLKADYFDGDGSLLTNISYNNLNDKPSLLSAAGSSNQIQYNNGSNGLAANSLLYWNTTSGQEGLVSNSTYIGRWTTNPAYAGFYNNNLTKNSSNYALIQSSYGETFVNSAPDFPLHLRIGNATKLLVASDGDVGIGTTTTNAKLEIKQKSDSAGGGIRLVEASSNSYWDIFLSDTAPDNRLEFAYGGATKTYIDKTDGSVVASYFKGDGSNLTDISTSNIPTFESDVRNQFSAGTDIGITNGVISFTGSVGTTTTAAGNAGEIQFNDGNDVFAASSNLYWDNTNGRLGINTNVPAAPLQFGNNAASGFSQHSYYQMILHYNATANYCYGLGIESGNMKFNSNGGYKFYVKGTEKISLSNTGNITATGFIGDGSQLTGITTSNLSGITSVSNGGTGFSSFSNGQFLVGNSSGTLSKHTFVEASGIDIIVGTSDTKIGVDNTVVRTSGVQSLYGIKSFNDKANFYGGFEATDGYFTDDFEVEAKFFVDVSTSRVGINDVTPSYTLDVNGSTRINSYLIVGNTSAANTAIRPPSDGNLDLGNSNHRWDDIWATNTSINSTSDERRKELIEDIPHGIELLNGLRPVQYKWKDYTQTTEDGITIESKFARKHFGIIAQELKATLEEKNISTNDFGAYVYDSDSDSYAVRYGEFVPILIKSVQELSKENKDLKSRIEILETLVASILD